MGPARLSLAGLLDTKSHSERHLLRLEPMHLSGCVRAYGKSWKIDR
jgi:hypothetical protein